jgi:hypothetical protein
MLLAPRWGAMLSPFDFQGSFDPWLPAAIPSGSNSEDCQARHRLL